MIYLNGHEVHMSTCTGLLLKEVVALLFSPSQLCNYCFSYVKLTLNVQAGNRVVQRLITQIGLDFWLRITQHQHPALDWELGNVPLQTKRKTLLLKRTRSKDLGKSL